MAALADQRIKECVRREEKKPLDYVGTVRRWWESMAPATRQHPWSIETVIAAAFKDPSKPPAVRLVAAALRSLGFCEKRDWTVAGRNRRYWTPPAEGKNHA